MDLQSLLSEIDLDIKELKFLISSTQNAVDSTSRRLLQRNIQQTKEHLDRLSALLDDEQVDNVHDEQPDVQQQEQDVVEVAAPTTVIGDKVAVAKDLRAALSLNDSFRFARELFDGDTGALYDFLDRISTLNRFDDAVSLLNSAVTDNEESNEAKEELLALIERFF